MTAGARVAALRHSVETGAVVKVQGTVTAVDQAGARFAVTGPWASAGTPCTGPGAGLEIENKGPGRGPGK